MHFVKEEKPVKTEHPLLGEISAEVETPQPESWEEVNTFHGSADNAFAFHCEAIGTSARNRARAYMRGFKVPEGTAPSEFPRITNEVRDKAIELARTYVPETSLSREPSKAKKAEKLDTIRERLLAGEEMSREELLSLVNY
ncbi:MAG: hypothetical protein ACREBU_19700 [Nitrososphaera sp.]